MPYNKIENYCATDPSQDLFPDMIHKRDITASDDPVLTAHQTTRRNVIKAEKSGFIATDIYVTADSDSTEGTKVVAYSEKTYRACINHPRESKNITWLGYQSQDTYAVLEETDSGEQTRLLAHSTEYYLQEQVGGVQRWCDFKVSELFTHSFSSTSASLETDDSRQVEREVRSSCQTYDEEVILDAIQLGYVIPQLD